MSLRDDFEKLFPTNESDAERQSALWLGFQVGHAAGLEAAEKSCIVIEDRYDALNETGRANAAFACAEAIRAMKP